MILCSSKFALTSIVSLIGGINNAAAMTVIQPPYVNPDHGPIDFLGPACSDEELQKKEFDLIVYGATGSVGQAIVDYLTNGHHPDEPRWAVAGRSGERLNLTYHVKDINFTNEVIVAPMNDIYKLEQMAKRTKVVLNCAGPYEESGAEDLIRATIGSCTHYVDLSGELTWGKQMLNKYNTAAKERGVAIVQSAGFHSTAADMLAMSTVNDALKYDDRMPDEITVIWTKINGQKTFGETASDRASWSKYGPNQEPYVLVPNMREEMMADHEVDGFLTLGGHGRIRNGYDERLMMRTLGVARAPWDCSVIRRSMALTFPGKKIHVREAGNDKMKPQNDRYQLHLIQNDPQGFLRVPAPKPNHLPPEWLRAAGSTAGFAVAFTPGFNSPSALVTMVQNGDPSTVASPVMAVEVAMSLARNGLPNGGGYLTPTLACPDLERRLNNLMAGNFLKTQHTQNPYADFWNASKNA